MPGWETYPVPEDRFISEWWQSPVDPDDESERLHRAGSLYNGVRGIEDSQRSAHEQNLWNARLYSNRELVSFDWGHGVFYHTTLAPVSLLGENLILSVVDTLVSRIGKNRVKIKPVPHGASLKTRRNAEKLDRWLYGEFVRMDVYPKAKRVFRDSAIFGFGCVKVQYDNGRLCMRRVFPDDLIIDQCEAVNTDDALYPGHVYERRARRVEEVEAEYGLPVGTIEKAIPIQGYLPYRAPGRGWVIVAEGYRLARNGVPGRHCVATNGLLLVDEAWNQEWSPYVWFHYNDPVAGFYWPGAVEQTLPFQVRLNEINEVIRDAQDLMARPRILVAEGSRINPQDIDNLTARIIKYTGVKPEALVWDAVSPELYNERERVIRACFEQFGITQLAAQGRLPDAARLDSSDALQMATTISDDRLADPTQRWEEWHQRLAKRMIDMMRTGGGTGSGPEGGGYETVWYSGGRKARAECINWKDIDLKEEAYTLTLEPASVFSMTPSAREDRLEHDLARGVIDRDQYLEMAGNPDIEDEYTLASAARKNLRWVQECLEDGKYPPPNPAQDLVQGVQLMTQAYLNLDQYDDVSEDVRDNFEKWIAMARAILEQGTQTAGALTQQANQVPGAQPPGGPIPGRAAAPGAMAPPSPMMPVPMMPTGQPQ